MRSAPFCEANFSRKLLRNPVPSLGQRPILTRATKAVKEAARPTVPRTDAPLAIHEPPWPCRARLRSGTVFLRALMEGPTVCVQCDMPEERCSCEKYCTICKGQHNIRLCFFFSSRRRHTRWNCDWSSDVCSSDLELGRRQLRLVR